MTVKSAVEKIETQGGEAVTGDFIFIEKPAYDLFKRIFDIFFSLTALIITSIPLLIFMFITYMYDKGNPVFTQERVGKNGKLIKVYKLRTMIVSAEERRKTERRDKEGRLLYYKEDNDPRVTPFGHFLRRTSADELLQFIDILRGDMSVIGPRPLIPSEHEEICKYVKRDLVKPGLSCYAAIYAKSKKSYDDYILHDFEYLQKRSVLTDIDVLIKTVWVLLVHRNF